MHLVKNGKCCYHPSLYPCCRVGMKQTEPQSADQYPWRYKPGESGNPLGPTAARKLRLDAKCRELAAEYGGWDGLSIIERTLVEQAATLLVRRKPASAEDAVRCANAVGRLLHAVERRRGRPAPKSPTFGDLLSADLARQAPAGESPVPLASSCPPAVETNHGAPQSDGEAADPSELRAHRDG
jgi:hypothetical protein